MKSDNALISIVTPSFNQGKFLSQTIESVVSQKYKPCEHFVFDGGSTDASVAVLKSYGKKINWVSKKDKGQSDAINKGMKKVTGDIVAYINSDDYYLPKAFDTVNAVFQENPSVMWVVGDALIVDETGKQIQSFVQLYKRFWRRFYFKGILHILNPFPQPAVFWRRTAMKKLGAFNQNLHFTMDYDYWMRLQQEFGQPYFIDKPLAAFRIHTASKGSVAFRKQFSEEEMVERKYNHGSLLHLLHKLHNQCILLAYGLIK